MNYLIEDRIFDKQFNSPIVEFVATQIFPKDRVEAKYRGFCQRVLMVVKAPFPLFLSMLADVAHILIFI